MLTNAQRAMLAKLQDLRSERGWIAVAPTEGRTARVLERLGLVTLRGEAQSYDMGATYATITAAGLQRLAEA